MNRISNARRECATVLALVCLCVPFVAGCYLQSDPGAAGAGGTSPDAIWVASLQSFLKFAMSFARNLVAAWLF